MLDQYKTLLEENNVISLRTAYVIDDGNIVDLRLMPKWLESSIPEGKPKGVGWVLEDSAWLYRHKRSADGEMALMNGFPCVEQDIKPMLFVKPPEFKLLWTDSGNSVALFLNGEPWALIHEETHRGYSKGILKPLTAKPWNQELFEKTFLSKEGNR
ncbi:MAG: hypothetical protein ABSD57_08325 [Verrucomicrobiota bacterium]|jgi:hypothetical protein